MFLLTLRHEPYEFQIIICILCIVFTSWCLFFCPSSSRKGQETESRGPSVPGHGIRRVLRAIDCSVDRFSNSWLICRGVIFTVRKVGHVVIDTTVGFYSVSSVVCSRDGNTVTIPLPSLSVECTSVCLFVFWHCLSYLGYFLHYLCTLSFTTLHSSFPPSEI